MRIFIISLLAVSLLVACEDSKTDHQNMTDSKSEHEHSEPDAKNTESPASKPDATTDESALVHAPKHLDVQYVCSMHPKEVSDKPGRCSICDMYLEKKEVE